MISARSDRPGRKEPIQQLPFQTLRLLALTALSVLAALHYEEAQLRTHASPIVWFIACASAIYLGIQVGELLKGSLEPRASAGSAVGIWVCYAAWLFWVTIAMSEWKAGQPPITSARGLPIAQVVFLALGGLLGSYKGAIVNAFVLVVICSFSGGEVAVKAVVSFGAALGFYLVFDNWERKLAAYPWSAYSKKLASRLWVPCLQSVLIVVPVATLAAWVFSKWRPGGPHSRVPQPWNIGAASGAAEPVGLLDAVAQLLVALLIGAALFHMLKKFMAGDDGNKGSAEQPGDEKLAASSADEGADEELRAPVATYPGARGRIVSSYVTVLRQAEASGLARRPGDTARELAPRLPQSPEKVAEITGLFERARYGSNEPSESEADRAETIARALETRT